MRVSEMRGEPTPGSVIDVCAVCYRAVYVDRVSTPDPPGDPLTLVCTTCSLENPGTRPQVLRMMTAAVRLGSVLPPADKRRGRGSFRKVNPVARERED